jgi:ribonuclease P protein component
VDLARLRRSRDIETIRSKGRRCEAGPFVVRGMPTDLGMVRIAVSAPRALGTAVERNRARRRVREAIRLALREHTTSGSADLLVMVRAQALSAPFSSLIEAARRALSAVLAREGRS